MCSNPHVPKEIIEKYPSYEFIGIPIVLRDGKRYIRAHHKVLGDTHFYSFDHDFFWFSREDIIPLLPVKRT